MTNETKISPDDARLTAYALGELEGEERAAVEAALRNDAAARTAVEEIRATARQLEAALAAEGDLGAEKSTPLPNHLEHYRTARKLVRFPYWLVAGVAAACFALIFAFWEPPPTRVREMAAQKKSAPNAMADENNIRLIEVPLEQPPAMVAADATDEKFAAAENKPVADMLGKQREAAQSNIAINEQRFVPNIRTVVSKDTFGRVPEGNLAAFEKFKSTEQSSPPSPPPPKDFNTESYAYHADNDFLGAAENPLSTFALDVDTASYANVRRFIQSGQLPPRDAVRIEELVNYFPYAYAAPQGDVPFAATLETASAPWAPTHRLVRIGLKAREVPAASRPAANLVFLIDVSGSMDEPNKLPLVQQSLRLLLDQLKPDDRVAIVTYAGESGLALPSTPASHRREILEALDSLHADGSTNGGRGLELAYDIAKANFISGGVNRVILATDGDFNVGVTDEGSLTRLVEEKARSGVELTALGFGTGNYRDAMFEQLADKGHGNYGYIDSLAEAKKLLVEQVGGTLLTVARDVKIQVEFNPAKVQSYRLIGYEDRLLKKEDFNNDAVTAGDVGSGHTVTALYEVVPTGTLDEAKPQVDPLKYQKSGAKSRASRVASDEMLTIKVRYTPPQGGPSRKLEFPLVDRGAEFAQASADFKFAAAAAGFGLVLRDSPYKGGATLAEVERWAEQGIGTDPGGYRHEFLSLVQAAEKLTR